VGNQEEVAIRFGGTPEGVGDEDLRRRFLNPSAGKSQRSRPQANPGALIWA